MTEQSVAGPPPPPNPPLLTATLEPLSDTVLVLDADGRFSYINRAAEEYLERSRASLSGKDVWAEFAPAEGGPFHLTYQSSRETGVPVHYEAFYEPLGKGFDVRVFLTGGLIVVHLRDVTRERHALDAPIHLGGALEGVLCHEHVGSARQWTADEQAFAVSVAKAIPLVLAQAERREAEKRLRRQASLLGQAHDAIMVCDLVHRVLDWSRGAGRIYGWTRDEVLGVALADRLYDDPAIYEGMIQQLPAKGEWSGELQHRPRSGQLLTVFARWSLFRDATGQPEAVLAINTDITERKRLEQQFLRAQRLEGIGTLAGGIAHDLNNMLAPIIMSVGLLRMTADDPARLDTLATIEASARRGADMVRQVLTFAREVSGRRGSPTCSGMLPAW